VHHYLEECRELGFGIVEISSGFISVPADDLVRLVEEVGKYGMKAKAEAGVQFGAGGASAVEELESEGVRDPGWAISQARRFLEGGLPDHVRIGGHHRMRTHVANRRGRPDRRRPGPGAGDVRGGRPGGLRLVRQGLRAEVNLFVDHSQIVQLECLRSGIWGTMSLWGRVLAYKG
jgi:hypothetical protein